MKTPYPRERRVYWVHKSEGEKDLLIYDAGYVGGDVHIYEFKESISSEKIEEEIKSFYKNNLPKDFLKEITRLWVEKNCGNSQYWNLTPS